jgi:hypothetical protein
LGHAFDSAGKADAGLSSPEVASGHFARLGVTLHVVANLPAFDDFAHTSAFDGRDMDKCVRVAIVRLNEAVAFGGIEPFNCASSHNRPFHSKLRYHSAKTLRMMTAIFEEGRSGRKC